MVGEEAPQTGDQRQPVELAAVSEAHRLSVVAGEGLAQSDAGEVVEDDVVMVVADALGDAAQPSGLADQPGLFEELPCDGLLQRLAGCDSAAGE